MQSMMAAQAGKASPESEWADFPTEDLPTFEDNKARSTPKQRRVWRRQLRDYFSELDDPRSDSNLGIQSLIDSGAITYDEDGLSTSVNMGRKYTDRMIDAADRWADKTGLWRPRPGGGEDFDPDNYRPYYSDQQRKLWEER